MNNETVVSTGEVADRLGIPTYKLQYLLSTGQIPEPTIRLAGKRAWRYSEIQKARQILENREAGDATEASDRKTDT